MKRRYKDTVTVQPKYGVDVSALPRSKRRKYERCEKKARRQAYHHRNKGVMQTEMERICQKLNIGPKPVMEKQRAVAEKEEEMALPEKISQKEIQEVRKMNFLRDNEEEEKNIKQLEKKLFLNKRKNTNMPRSFIDEGLDYILELTDQKYKDKALAREAAETGTDISRFQNQGNAENSQKHPPKKPKHQAPSDIESDDETRTSGSEDDEGSDEEIGSGEESAAGDEEDEEMESEEDLATDSNEDPDVALPQRHQGRPKETKTKVEAKKADEMTRNRKVRFDLPVASSEEDECDDIDEDDGGDSDEGGDDDGGDSDEGDSHVGGEGEEECKPEIWEDIYGRKRDRAGNVIVEKYVPPAKRAESMELSAEKKRELQALKKQLKGLLNRLSESTVQPIGSQVEELYRKYSNHDVNSTLLDVLCEAIVAPFLTPQRLVMEHAMLVAYLHCNVATEVGAYILENLTTKFNSLYEHISEEGSGKEVDNCVLFICFLFVFKVTHSRLIFDIIKKLSASFADRDVEVILLILRSVGFGLRKHDPATLKETVLSLQKKSLQDAEQDSRKKFMLDVLMAIRNNNIQKIPNCDPSMVEHASKVLRNLCRKGSAIQELNISLEDLLQAKERGKWWVVGSAWAGTVQDASADESKAKTVPNSVAFTSKIVELAKKHHMNTDIRRNVFCIIMTAEDYLDASEKILRLNLSVTQEREVCYVLLHCCMKEKKYNPYYSHLAKFFCKRDRRFYMSLQCALWDKVKELDQISRVESSNLAQFLKTLLCEDVLSLAVLKTVQFVDMSASLVRFLRQVFIGMFTSATSDVVRKVFSRIADPPKLRLLREGVRLFLRQLQEAGSGDAKLQETLQNSVREADAALASAESRDF